MALARVVSFDGVDADRMREMLARFEGSDGPPDGVPATEFLVLHDPDAEQALAVMFFDDEDGYRQGDAVLDAMPAGDTPGSRSGVRKYVVAFRTTA